MRDRVRTSFLGLAEQTQNHFAATRHHPLAIDMGLSADVLYERVDAALRYNARPQQGREIAYDHPERCPFGSQDDSDIDFGESDPERIRVSDHAEILKPGDR